MLRKTGFIFLLVLTTLLCAKTADARMDQQCDDEIEIAQRKDRSAHMQHIEIANKCISKEPTDEFYRHVKGIAEYGLGKINAAIRTMQDTADMQEFRNVGLQRPEKDHGLRLGMTYWLLTTFKFYKATTEPPIKNAEELFMLTSKLSKVAGCTNLRDTPSGTDTFLNQQERVAACVDMVHLNAWLKIEMGSKDMGCKMLDPFKGKRYSLGLAPLDLQELHKKCSIVS